MALRISETVIQRSWCKVLSTVVSLICFQRCKIRSSWAPV